MNGLSPYIDRCLLMRGKLSFGVPTERATGRFIQIDPIILALVASDPGLFGVTHRTCPHEPNLCRQF
jgi:hypothetical protein